MKELLKTVQKTAAPAKQEKKVAAKKAAIPTFVPEKGAPYRLLSADHKWFSAYTVAAFIHSGMLTFTKTGLPTGKAGDADLWSKIVGSTAAPYWKKIGRVEDSKLTVKGMNEVRARMRGETKYPTSKEHVDKMVELLSKGGELKVKENTIKFNLSA